ncbi:MAG: glycosyltransferase family 4 protein, partial [Acidobacteriia bacterium]|nr:glycosyltransferase family 4 protein [Terriglobia bacterium]
MRILVLDQFSELGGAQACLLMGVAAMRDRGWRVAAGLAGGGELFGRIRELGCETFRVTCGPFGLGQKSISDAARFLTQLPRLASEIRHGVEAFRPDLVYLNGPRLLPAAALAGIKIPVLFHAHHNLASPGLRQLAGKALSFLQASAVACCRSVAESISPFVDSARLSVVFNGVAGPPRIRVRRRVSAPTIGCIGRISPEKGQMEFVAAARLIHRTMPESRFLIYGAPLFSAVARRYQRRVIKAARGLPVAFPGWTHDVYSALARFDLLLVPSARNEATTRVILEAFAVG